MNSAPIISRLLFLLIASPLMIFGQQVKNNNSKKTNQEGSCDLVFSIGNLTGPRVNIDSFKAQKKIHISCGFSFVSANVYFSGSNFKDIGIVTLTGDLLTPMSEYINKCDAGSVVSFDNIKVLTKDGVRTIDGRSFTFYRGGDSVKVPISTVNQEIFDLMKKDFVSGKIYFSGTNFDNVTIVNASAAGSLKAWYNRCVPGTIISFENCVYREPGNTLSKPVTKTLKLE